MTEDEARAWRFMRRGDAGGETEEAVPLGIAVRDRRVPLRHDSNYLFVERPAGADEIQAELGRLDLPVAVVPRELDHPAVDQRGVVMVHRGEASRGHAEEVTPDALEPIRREQMLHYPWGTPEVIDQLLAARRLIAERVTVRCFAALEDGAVVAGTDLYLDPPDAQIEDVLTVEAARGRGHGTSVVRTALAEAYAAGAGFVFLVADAEDWPKDWYARLGFEPVGGYVKLRRP